MNILKHAVIKYTLILLLTLYCQSLLADEQNKGDNTYLKVARTQLNLAFENHNKGDISASKKNLKSASEWLYKAVQHSRSDIVKNEAQKLAADIDSFRLTLNKSSKKNTMARFWHQTTSFIIRESEHLIHDYAEASTKNKIFRHLLDAKMHFNNADHDLFLSHDLNDAIVELSNSLEYLAQAGQLAKPELKPYTNQLITGINELITLSESYKSPWKKNTLIHSLDNAINNLNEAESFASPPVRMRLKSIHQTVSTLRRDIQKTNLKAKYELIRTKFSRAIHNIES